MTKPPQRSKAGWLTAIGIAFLLTSPFTWIAVLRYAFDAEVFEGDLLGVPVVMVLGFTLLVHIIVIVASVIILKNLFDEPTVT